MTTSSLKPTTPTSPRLDRAGVTKVIRRETASRPTSLAVRFLTALMNSLAAAAF
jgi:hypothetical protein